LKEKELCMTKDHIEIQATISQYSVAAGMRDVDTIVSTFAVDGVWDVAALPAPVKGHEALRTAMKALLEPMENFFQLNAPAIIELHGDRATARTGIREGGKLAGSNIVLDVMAFYDDELLRTPQGWKFARRKLTVVAVNRYTVVSG
jgi:ketosteroid isomerase-like protein